MTAMDRPAGAGRGSRRLRPLALRVHLLLLTLAVLLPALGAGGLTAWQLGGAYRDSMESALQGGARTLAVTIDREIEVAITAAASLAASRAMRGAWQAGIGPADDASLAEAYARALAVGEAFGGWMLLVDAQGRQLFNTQRPLGAALPPAAGLPWVTEVLATGAPVVSDLFLGSVTQRRVLAALVPVPGSASPRVLMLAFDPSRLASLLAHTGQGQIAGLIQVQDGIIIARSVGHATASGQAAPDWVSGPMRAHATGLVTGASLEGPSIVAAFRRLDRVPWAVVVTTPRDEYQAAWHGPMRRLALGAAGLLVVALMLAALVARRLLRPVQALVREAEAVIAAAPPPPPAPPAPVAEFEALRQALTRASDALRARAVSEGRAAAAEDAAQILRAERDRSRLYFDMAQAILVVIEAEGTVRSINRHGLLILGLRQDTEAAGRDWFEAFVPPTTRPRFRAAFLSLVAGRAESTTPQEYAVLRADGAERLVAWRKTLLRDPGGQRVAVIASGEDITDRRAAEAQQVLLMREVDHRAKNVLAAVQSILRLTRAERQQDFASTVEGRVNALARAHTLLARERWVGGDLRELVETELAPYAAAGGIRITGPRLRLVPDAVQPVSLVLHELATNAAKHGALSGPGGRLEVAWSIEPNGQLRVAWTETGVQPALLAGPPTRRGFGSRMIAATVGGQLHGSIEFDWRAEGLRFVVLIAADRIAPTTDMPPLRDDAPPDPPTAGEAGDGLAQRRVLVVEDEPLVAMDVEAALRALGCQVLGPTGTLAEGLRLAEQEAGRLDAAVVDVNLDGQDAFPIAAFLLRRGVPVVFATGYSVLPDGWMPEGGAAPTAMLRKPLDRDALADTLSRLLAQRPRQA